MKSSPSAEKTKPFRLVKYFTYISLIVIFFGALILSVLNTRLSREMLFKKNEGYARILIENLNHQIFTQYILPYVTKYGKTQLSQPEQFKRVDTIIRNTLHSFKVEMVSIYDMQNTISYSFDMELIGLKGLGGSAYQKALSGESTTRLRERATIWGLLVGSSKESRIITVAPLRAERSFLFIADVVIGVIEIVQDVSEDYRAIFRFQIRVILTIMVVMGSLFLVLIIVVKRGQGIIEKRAREQIKLKEQLGRAEHLSTLGEMVAAVSHEIRNPLGIIMSSAELLKKKTVSNTPSSAIPEIIVEEAGRLNDIITDFLNFAKPKAPNFVACRIEDILEKNIKFFASDIKGETYRIEKRSPTDLPQIIADPNMLYQAFLNLLINARQAMPGGGRIMIELSANDSKIKIHFEDEGPGIQPDVLSKIWDPFFTTKETGTGLGLGIVKNIIEAHDGQISFENRSVKGARMTIELPIQPEI